VPTTRAWPMVLDMATSVVAGGKLDVARSKGESIPLGWARDKYGNPTTDPVAARQGFLEPVGDHKVSTQESSAVFTSKTRSAGHLDGNVNSSCIDVPYLP
jgi:Malate/L-lactate dehydrogenase